MDSENEVLPRCDRIEERNYGTAALSAITCTTILSIHRRVFSASETQASGLGATHTGKRLGASMHR